MKLALINGSPKRKDSASETILQDLQSVLPKTNEYINLAMNAGYEKEIDYEELKTCDSIVIAFPLYVDGVPSHLLRRLCEMEKFFQQDLAAASGITVYVIANCGFYEGTQNKFAIQIMKNWCYRAGLRFGCGVGIGAGGMLAGLKNVPVGKGPKTNQGKVFVELAELIQYGRRGDDRYLNPNFPSFLYKMAAQYGWRKAIKENGLKKKELFRRL